MATLPSRWVDSSTGSLRWQMIKESGALEEVLRLSCQVAFDFSGLYTIYSYVERAVIGSSSRKVRIVS